MTVITEYLMDSLAVNGSFSKGQRAKMTTRLSTVRGIPGRPVLIGDSHGWQLITRADCIARLTRNVLSCNAHATRNLTPLKKKKFMAKASDTGALGKASQPQMLDFFVDSQSTTNNKT